VSKDLWDAKDALAANKPEDALDKLQDALRITDELTDKRARRAVLRVTLCPRLPAACAKRLLSRRSAHMHADAVRKLADSASAD
jgi:hypothetical protein